MSQSMPQEESKVRFWLVFIILSALALILIFVIGEISRLVGSIAVASESMLRTLIETEATILGFFGLIFVYALTSFDNRLDKLEEQLFKLTTEKHSDIPEELLRAGILRLKMGLSNIEKNKKELVNDALGIGILLVASLILSILSLGLISMPVAVDLCQPAVAFFFLSIGYIFWMFRKLAKPPEARARAFTDKL